MLYLPSTQRLQLCRFAKARGGCKANCEGTFFLRPALIGLEVTPNILLALHQGRTNSCVQFLPVRLPSVWIFMYIYTVYIYIHTYVVTLAHSKKTCTYYEVPLLGGIPLRSHLPGGIIPIIGAIPGLTWPLPLSTRRSKAL